MTSHDYKTNGKKGLAYEFHLTTYADLNKFKD